MGVSGDSESLLELEPTRSKDRGLLSYNIDIYTSKVQINSVEEIFLIVATNCLANLYIHMVGLLPFRPFLFSKFEPFFLFITLCRALKTLLKTIAQRPRDLSRKSQSSGVRFVNGSVSIRMNNEATGEMLSRELALRLLVGPIPVGSQVALSALV